MFMQNIIFSYEKIIFCINIYDVDSEGDGDGVMMVMIQCNQVRLGSYKAFRKHMGHKYR